MLQFYFIKNLSYFLISHLLCCLLFSLIYYKLFDNIDKHYIRNININKEEYLKNKWTNSLYLSINMQTTTGYVDFNLRSPTIKFIVSIQLLLSLFISLSVIYIGLKKL
jgi:hypothetical protein